MATPDVGATSKAVSAAHQGGAGAGLQSAKYSARFETMYRDMVSASQRTEADFYDSDDE